METYPEELLPVAIWVYPDPSESVDPTSNHRYTYCPAVIVAAVKIFKSHIPLTINVLGVVTVKDPNCKSTPCVELVMVVCADVVAVVSRDPVTGLPALDTLPPAVLRKRMSPPETPAVP